CYNCAGYEGAGKGRHVASYVLGVFESSGNDKVSSGLHYQNLGNWRCAGTQSRSAPDVQANYGRQCLTMATIKQRPDSRAGDRPGLPSPVTRPALHEYGRCRLEVRQRSCDVEVLAPVPLSRLRPRDDVRGAGWVGNPPADVRVHPGW